MKRDNNNFLQNLNRVVGGRDFRGLLISLFLVLFIIIFSQNVNATTWWNDSWGYRQPINISVTSENLTDYQVKIQTNLTDEYNAGKLNSTCKDIRVTNSTDSLINFWIEECNITGSNSTIWVEVPKLTNNINTTVYMYYGNNDALSLSNFSVAMTKLIVDSDHLGVYHADEGSGTSIFDETGNNNMTLSNSSIWVGVDGGTSGLDGGSQFSSGNSLDFAGTYYAEINNVLDNVSENGQVSFWFKFDNTFNASATTSQRLFTKFNNNSPFDFIDLYANEVDGKLQLRKWNNGSAKNITTSKTSWTGGTWYHVRVAWGYEGLFIYINNSLTDGAADYSVRDSFGNGTLADFTWGAYWDGTTRTQSFEGEMDELEISSSHRSAIKAKANYERRKVVSDPWVKYENNPIIGHIHSSIDRWIGESNILKLNNTYHAFFTGGNNTGGNHLNIYYSNSSNALNWTNSTLVIEDHLRAYVMKDKINEKWYLYAIDWDDGQNSYYDLYTADELAGPWNSQSSVLTKGGSGQWDDSQLGNLAVIKEGSNYYMWYEASDVDTGTWDVGYANSSDGKTWTKHSSNPILSWASGPEMHKIGNIYYMIGHTVFKHSGVLPSDITWWTSTNRINWTEQSPTPIIQRNANASNDQLADVWILEEENRTLMYVSALPDQVQTTSRIWVYVAENRSLYQALYPEPSGSIGLEENESVTPTIFFSCLPTSVQLDEQITCSCSATDNFDSSPTVSYSVNPSTSSTGTFTTECTAEDDTGNSASSSISYTVSRASGGGYPTFKPSQEQMEEGYEKSLRKNWKIEFEINREKKILEVKKISNNKVVVSVDKKDYSVDLNETGKIDLDDDGYYDLQISVKEVQSNGYAKLEFKEIHEEILSEEQEEQQSSSKFKIRKDIWIAGGLVVLIVICVVIRRLLKKK